MKKSLILCLLLSVSLMLGCELSNSSDDKENNDPTTGTLKVTVHYTGAGTVSASNKLYIAATAVSTGILWADDLRIPSAITNPGAIYGSDFLAESSTDDTEMTLTLEAGEYYIVAAWDHDNDFTKNYIFNKNTQYIIYDEKIVNDTTPDYTPITITAGETVSLEMTIDGTHLIAN